MPAVVIATAYGGPEVLSVADQPVPDPGPGEARIEVKAAGVNPVDSKVYSGAFGADPDRLPIRLGSEAAGVVTKPAVLDWPQASGLMLTGATAWHTLAATGVEEGDTVLIHAASGGVGLMAVQLATARGAVVVATASPVRHELLRELGAVPVAYGEGLVDRVRAAAPGGIDAALDLIGTDEAVDVSLALVTDRARIATIAAFARGQQEGIKVLGGAPGADPGTEIRDAARLELARLAQDQVVRVFVTRTYPLADVADAHRAIMTGHTTGKIALIP
jgi:NADPH:quinone reductase